MDRGGAVVEEAVEDVDPRLAEDAPAGRDVEVPLHHDGNVDVVRAAVAGVPAHVVVDQVEPEADGDAVVDVRNEAVVDDGDREARAHAEAVARVHVVPPEQKVGLRLEVVGGVVAGVLDGVVGPGRGGEHERENRGKRARPTRGAPGER